MKSRLKITSIMVLVAMVFSLVPALASPSQASAAACYHAQFVADVTVPDGAKYEPGTAFKKTWRLRNIGTCAWNSSDITMIFDSGAQMGAPASVALPSTVAPGSTVDISVDMTAPTAAGHYIGYWKLKSAQGTIFGIGVQANKAWWVEINVTSTAPGGSVVFDFTAGAKDATWSSGAGGLTFPGKDGEAKGFALTKDKPKFESGVELSKPGLLFVPQNITNGFIQAEYPAYKVDPGDSFQTTVGCEFGATSCYVAYRLDYKVGNTIKTFWTFRERYEGWTYNANISLAPLSGQEVRFILYISAYGSPSGDRALWGNPVITRKGIVPPPPTVTGTPPTATPSKTPPPVTQTVPPSSCDKVQFVADVNIPDGSVLQPGAQFTKTWRLKNVGSCAWNTSYQLVYFSGEQMGAASSANFPKNVAVGETVDISINMTAPTASGSYRGFWMFKNANGALFGIGAQANKPWWVDIKVTGGPTVTPVTPSATASQGGPTATPSPTQNPTSGWEKLQNAKYGFSVDYPKGSTLVTASDTSARIDLPILVSGTNLSEKYVLITVAENSTACKSPDIGGQPSATENVTINGLQFFKESGAGAGAGNRYDYVAYSTLSNNNCISLTFVLHSLNPGNFPTPPPEFDKTAESAVFDLIIKTFTKTG